MKSEHGEERRFGVPVGTILAAIGAYWTFRGRFAPAGPLLLALGGVLVLLGVLFPAVLVGPRKAWMRLAEALSTVTTALVLLLVFALVVTPIGVLRRLLGGDPLRRRSAPGGSSWHPYPRRHLDRRHYDKAY